MFRQRQSFGQTCLKTQRPFDKHVLPVANTEHKPHWSPCSLTLPQDNFGSLSHKTSSSWTTNHKITIDHYSDFYDQDPLTNTQSSTIIDLIKSHFAHHGIPVSCLMDNSPQFISNEYKEFVQIYGFEHITLSPYWSCSNGKAEAAVKDACRRNPTTSSTTQHQKYTTSYNNIIISSTAKGQTYPIYPAYLQRPTQARASRSLDSVRRDLLLQGSL